MFSQWMNYFKFPATEHTFWFIDMFSNSVTQFFVYSCMNGHVVESYHDLNTHIPTAGISHVFVSHPYTFCSETPLQLSFTSEL